MTRVKICGCRTVEHALAAADAGADFVGINFVAESRRKVSVEEASEIVRALGSPLGEIEQMDPPALFRAEAGDLRSWYEHGANALDRLLARKRPLTVGVFANNDPTQINEIVDACGIDLVQLSGDEPWGACLLVNRQSIRVLHVRSDDTAASALDRVQPAAMAILLDRADPSAYGGTGQTLDWATAAAIRVSLPIWLAGGLTPENVGEAISIVRPWCVDVASGVETNWVKDASKIRAFVAAVRDAG